MTASRMLKGFARRAWDQGPITPHRDGRASRRLNALRFVLAVQSFLLLSACSLHQPYPVAWGSLPPPPTQDCYRFAGSYSDLGSDESLARQLFPSQPDSKFWAADRVSLSLPSSDVLEVTAWKGQDQLFSRMLTSEAGRFTCDAGRLIVRPGARWEDADVGVVRESLTLTLTATDDYLVVEDQVKSFGIIFFVPMLAEETGWYRFPRLRRVGERWQVEAGVNGK